MDIWQPSRKIMMLCNMLVNSGDEKRWTELCYVLVFESGLQRIQ